MYSSLIYLSSGMHQLFNGANSVIKKGVIMPKQTLKGISIPSISGIDELVSGDFGELLVSYYLVKKKLHVIVAKSEGFDLLVNDTRGLLFEKDKLIGISVKTRQKRSLCLDLDIASDKLKRATKIWKFIPYFCYVTPCEEFFLQI